MSDHGTAISWTHAPGYRGETWNPVTGCSRVSEGCDICYAEALSLRRGWSALPWTPENAEANVVLHPGRLDAPHRWRAPRQVFTNSMSDLFHPRVPSEFILRAWGVMRANPRHRFLTLTKRPKRLRDWTLWAAARESISPEEIWPDWMWVGTSIESREYVGRADLLRETPAALRFISAEPLLGPLVYDFPLGDLDGGENVWRDGHGGAQLDLDGISWLIAGGESGSGHRPMDLAWMRDLLAACRESGTAFFAKQDSGPRPGARGRIPDDLWLHEWPAVASRVGGALF